MKEQLVQAIADMEEDQAMELTEAMLAADVDPQEILDACREAMTIVGQRYEAGEYFLPELVIAGDMLTAIGDRVKPLLQSQTAGSNKLGTVVIGTVEGDIHDIGKDIVGFMLDVNGFEVVDLGADFAKRAEDTYWAELEKADPEFVGKVKPLLTPQTK